MTPVFRFAPSPNGHLHLGHAYSALLNQKLARENRGKLLLRIEDIDTVRCTPQLEGQMLEDLEWLGLVWDEAPIRQSERFVVYRSALERLRSMGLTYPAFMSRKAVQQWIDARPSAAGPWPKDPDGSPHYPGQDKHLSRQERERNMAQNQPFAERLDGAVANTRFGPLTWREFDPNSPHQIRRVAGDPEKWGDVILRRKDTPTSYHLSSVLDDASQGVTHIVRGSDLYESTSIHRLLQTALDLPEPVYHHHPLILDDIGAKLAKSKGHPALRDLRAEGISPGQVHKWLGF